MRKQVWTSLNKREKAVIDRAVELAGWDSRSAFLRQLALAHARRILRDHAEQPPTPAATSEEEPA